MEVKTMTMALLLVRQDRQIVLHRLLETGKAIMAAVTLVQLHLLSAMMATITTTTVIAVHQPVSIQVHLPPQRLAMAMDQI